MLKNAVGGLDPNSDRRTCDGDASYATRATAMVIPAVERYLM